MLILLGDEENSRSAWTDSASSPRPQLSRPAPSGTASWSCTGFALKRSKWICFLFRIKINKSQHSSVQPGSFPTQRQEIWLKLINSPIDQVSQTVWAAGGSAEGKLSPYKQEKQSGELLCVCSVAQKKPSVCRPGSSAADPAPSSGEDGSIPGRKTHSERHWLWPGCCVILTHSFVFLLGPRSSPVSVREPERARSKHPDRPAATRRALEPAACYRLLPLEAPLSDHRALSQLQLSGRRHEPLELNTDVSQATNQRRPLCVEETTDDPTLTPSGRKMEHTYPGLGRKSINIMAVSFICMEKFGNKIYLRWT